MFIISSKNSTWCKVMSLLSKNHMLWSLEVINTNEPNEFRGVCRYECKIVSVVNYLLTQILVYIFLYLRPWITGSGFRTRSKNFKTTFFQDIKNSFHGVT